MKALLVVASDKAYKLVAFYLKPLGFELIRYRLPIKAMDNIDEIDPDAVIVSAEDFPRHWKTLVQFVRNERPKEKTTIVLLKGWSFPFEEAAKATFIGVHGIVSENLDNPEELDRLQSILGRYAPVDEDRVAHRVRPADWDRLEFIFSAPADGSIVTGRIETVSVTGISFIPDRPAVLEGIAPGAILKECAFRVDDAIVSVDCRVVRLGKAVAFAYENMEEADHDKLKTYLIDRPLRERRHMG
jgi:hypothetical protein